MFFRLSSLIGACLLVACVDPACDSTPDVCNFALFQKATPTSAQQASEQIQRFQDPIVRTAAVNHWLRLNPKSTTEDGNMRVSAAHLRR
jgi:hypothetical protein